jgi:hypothetical protein
MNESKRYAVLGLMSVSALTLGACGPSGASDPVNWHYAIEIGFTNNVGDHVAASSLIVQGNGSHKGAPGIYANGNTVMPFVDRGPCAAGSPCWVGVVVVPRDGQHEFSITASVKTTPAEWRILAFDGDHDVSHNLYCQLTRDGRVVSLIDNTGVGYSVTPVQTSGEHSVTCSAHN